MEKISMNLTQQQLKQIIKEELSDVLSEAKNRQYEEFVGKYRPGVFRLFRYSTRGQHSNAETIPVDPMHFTKNRKSYSNNEYNTSGFPRSFWYADADDKESFVNGKLYYWDVPVNRIYDFKKDPENIIEMHRHKQYRYIDWDALFKYVSGRYDGVFYTLGRSGQPVVAYFKWVDSVAVPDEIVKSRDFSALEPLGG